MTFVLQLLSVWLIFIEFPFHRNLFVVDLNVCLSNGRTGVVGGGFLFRYLHRCFFSLRLCLRLRLRLCLSLFLRSVRLPVCLFLTVCLSVYTHTSKQARLHTRSFSLFFSLCFSRAPCFYYTLSTFTDTSVLTHVCTCARARAHARAHTHTYLHARARART